MKTWFADFVLGVLVGGIIGSIVAVNVVIFAGIEGGYEAGIGDVFSENAVVGIVTVGVLIAGPVVGVVLARRRRSRLRVPGSGHR